MGNRKRLVRHEKALTRVEMVKMNLWNCVKKCLTGVQVTLELRFLKKTGPGYGHPPKLSRDQGLVWLRMLVSDYVCLRWTPILAFLTSSLPGDVAVASGSAEHTEHEPLENKSERHLIL